MRAFSFVGGVALLSAVARAEPTAARSSSLSWIRLEGAESCVATQDLAREVEGRLGRNVFVSASQADVSVEGHIAPQKGAPGFRAEITIRDNKGTLLGTRELVHAGACAEMHEPLAFIIAVMIDPDAKLVDPKAPPLDPPNTLPVEPQIPAVVSWRFDAAASGVAAFGLLPNVGFGVTAGGILEPPRFLALEGAGTIWFDGTTQAGNGKLTFSLLSLSGGLCPLTFHSKRFHAYGCASAHIGLMRVRSTGFTVPKADNFSLFLAGALEARATVRIAGPISLRAGASFLVPVMRDRFTYSSNTGAEIEAFQMSPVAAIADVGFGVVFP